MKSLSKFLPLLIGWLLAATGVDALTPQMQEFKIKVSGVGEVVVQMSSAWNRMDAPTPQTLLLNHVNGAVSVQLTFMAKPAQGFENKENLEARVLDIAKGFLSGAVEKKVEPVALKTNSGLGSYVTLTDARLVDVGTPAKGDYRYMNTGIRVTDKFVVIFTILTNVQSGDDLLSAFQIVGEGGVTK